MSDVDVCEECWIDVQSMQESGLIPAGKAIPYQNSMPEEIGVGFADIGTTVRSVTYVSTCHDANGARVQPDSDARCYDHAAMLKWRGNFYARYRGHVRRVKDYLNSVKNAAVACAGAGDDVVKEVTGDGHGDVGDVVGPALKQDAEATESMPKIERDAIGVLMRSRSRVPAGADADAIISPQVVIFTGKRQFQ